MTDESANAVQVRRGLTKAQVARHLAIIAYLGAGRIATPDELRYYLAGRKGIYVTVDTVARDLRRMEEIGTVTRQRHPTAGHEMGRGSWVAYTGWRLKSRA